jgi:hypothetical protein
MAYNGYGWTYYKGEKVNNIDYIDDPETEETTDLDMMMVEEELTHLDGSCTCCGRPYSLIDPLTKLDKDIRQAARTLDQSHVRWLVDHYYQLQRDRIRSKLQADKAAEGNEPNDVLIWVRGNSAKMESNIRAVLNTYTDSNSVGQWSKTIVGIGPVLAAGLLAHIDIAKAPTVGHIWRFAGLDPTIPQRQQKGVRSPYNKRLKTLCWKIGESFVKVCNRTEDVYGHIYAARKALEIALNDEYTYKDQAAQKLATTNIGKTTDAYKHYSEGKLPPAHIHSRAKRYAVKIFLSHWHHVAFQIANGGTPPVPPYVISHLGHVDYIAPPNWPMK